MEVETAAIAEDVNQVGKVVTAEGAKQIETAEDVDRAVIVKETVAKTGMAEIGGIAKASSVNGGVVSVRALSAETAIVRAMNAETVRVKRKKCREVNL